MIVAEAFARRASVCEVARRRDVVAGQIYRWRKELTAAAAFTEGIRVRIAAVQ
jgi:transposase-like protein